ncbi:hypothetical protein ABPG72_019032 [Tetrahymena utriculariae]
MNNGPAIILPLLYFILNQLSLIAIVKNQIKYTFYVDDFKTNSCYLSKTKVKNRLIEPLIQRCYLSIAQIKTIIHPSIHLSMYLSSQPASYGQINLHTLNLLFQTQRNNFNDNFKKKNQQIIQIILKSSLKKTKLYMDYNYNTTILFISIYQSILTIAIKINSFIVICYSLYIYTLSLLTIL